MNLSDESLIWQKELADWTQLKDLTGFSNTPPPIPNTVPKKNRRRLI
jgi:hypothetical protein